jgi:murein DD-endopeptidase MepM/ murein hydrolase activator NlpD
MKFGELTRTRAIVRPLLLAIACLVWLVATFSLSSLRTLAAPPPETPTVATANVTAPAPAATPEPPQPSTQTPTPTSTSVPVVEPNRARRKRAHARPTRVATAAPSPSDVDNTHKHSTPQRHKHSAKAKPTPTPVPSPTASFQLQVDNTISPISCNGKGKPPAVRPFLLPPFHGFTAIESYFDHDLPDFAVDGEVVITTGLQVSYDQDHNAANFPGYWSASLRQYVYYDGHNGYDFNLRYQPVYAAAAGKVIFSRFEYPDAHNHGYGLMVMIDHRNGYFTLYGHFSKLTIKAGQKVRAGQRLGTSGNSGHSSGPHLHFSVFHNCNPTDPYGWSGAGPDPLQQYQGESAVMLWKKQPLVSNPPPDWPGLSKLPGTSVTRLLLLRLPSTSAGAKFFVQALMRRLEAAESALHVSLTDIRIDPLRGALIIRSPILPGALYSIPDVASIAASDASPDARTDVLSWLARAELAGGGVGRQLTVGTAHGTVMSLGVYDILVGKGNPGHRVSVRVPVSRGHLAWVSTVTDRSTGAYALDLGKLTRDQYIELFAMLRTHSGAIRTSSSPIKSVRSILGEETSMPADPPHSATTRLTAAVVATVLLLLIAAGGAFYARRRA